MPSPKRLLKYLSHEDVQAEYDDAFLAYKNGCFTSTSGGGKSSTRQQVEATQRLLEAKCELDARNANGGPSRTTQDFSQLQEHNVTNT